MTDNQKKAAYKRVVRDGGRKSGEEQEDVNEEEDVGEINALDENCYGKVDYLGSRDDELNIES